MPWLPLLGLSALMMIAGAALVVALRLRQRRWRCALVGGLVVLVPILPIDTAVLPPASPATIFLVGAALLSLLSLAHRWLAAVAVALWAGIASVLAYGLAPIYGWGLIAIPPFIAGIVLASARPGRRTLQSAFIAGWSFLLLLPATSALANELDRLGWHLSRAATGYDGPLAPAQLATLAAAIQQREVGTTLLYLLITLGTLGLAWLPAAEWLAGASRRLAIGH